MTFTPATDVLTFIEANFTSTNVSGWTNEKPVFRTRGGTDVGSGSTDNGEFIIDDEPWEPDNINSSIWDINSFMQGTFFYQGSVSLFKDIWEEIVRSINEENDDGTSQWYTIPRVISWDTNEVLSVIEFELQARKLGVTVNT